MSKSKEMRKSPRLSHILELEDFEGLTAELQSWRTDKYVQTTELKKGSGLVLGFVKGLRLSARLIYAIRKNLSTTSLEVDWGHLLDKDGMSLSPECDIIIHKKGYVREWNGNSNPVMNFKFIKSTDTIAVISCKSYAKSIDKPYKAYCERIREYVNNVMLFAECCPKRRAVALNEKAKKAGYKGFWYLYSVDEQTNETCKDPKVWENFLRTLKKVCGARN